MRESGRRFSLVAGCAMFIAGMLLLSWTAWDFWHLKPAGAATAAPGVFLSASVLDLGPVERGTTARGKIQLENRGSHAYELAFANADCSCTALVPDNRALPPGGRLNINVEVDARGFSETFGRSVLLRLQEGQTHYDIRVGVRGTLRSNTWLVALPARVEFDAVAPGQRLEKTIHFVGPRDIVEQLPPLLSASDGPSQPLRLRCDQTPALGAARSTRSVKISLPLAESASAGSVDRTIEIELHGAISQKALASGSRGCETDEDGEFGTTNPLKEGLCAHVLF